jgi:tRNA(Ile)-lysidine synthase
MRSLADGVRRTIRRYALADPTSRVLVALSGGPDSVALAAVLHELAAAGAFTLVGLAHFNHQLRPTAGRDEAFCREFAARLGLPLVVESADIRAVAARRHSSIEDAARDARYAFLDRAAARLGADRVAVGHTRDDQAETFLLRLLRGAGPRGLAGIYPRARLVIRPFIDTTREEVLAYLASRGLAFCDDETNRDLSYPRNRIRHELLPYLRQHFSPAVVSVLAREAAIARDDAAWLEAAAAEAESRCVRVAGETAEVALDTRALAAEPPALARRIVRRALARVAPARFLSFEHVEAVLELAGPDPPAGGLDLPGQRAERVGDWVVLRPKGTAVPGVGTGGCATGRGLLEPRVLPVPGEVALPEIGWVVSAEAGVASEDLLERLSARGLEVAVDLAAVERPLAVRTRRPGDRLRPLGLRGHKKLQDLLVDKKIATAERDRIPLVVDARDRIVWVVGLTIEEGARVTPASRAVLFLKATRLGGQV